MDALTLPYGYVTGRFVLVVGDTSADADRLPDATPVSGQLRLEPVQTRHIATAPTPTTALAANVTLQVDAEGYIVDPAGSRGVWLIAGAYRVTSLFDTVTLPPFLIEVTTAHTQSTPLDLTMAAPTTSPPSPVPGWQAVTATQYNAMQRSPSTVYLIVED